MLVRGPVGKALARAGGSASVAASLCADADEHLDMAQQIRLREDAVKHEMTQLLAQAREAGPADSRHLVRLVLDRLAELRDLDAVEQEHLYGYVQRLLTTARTHCLDTVAVTEQLLTQPTEVA